MVSPPFHFNNKGMFSSFYGTKTCLFRGTTQIRFEIKRLHPPHYRKVELSYNIKKAPLLLLGRNALYFAMPPNLLQNLSYQIQSIICLISYPCNVRTRHRILQNNLFHLASYEPIPSSSIVPVLSPTAGSLTFY